LPPCSPAPEPDVDDVIRDANHVLVVLDDEHRVALIAQLEKDVDETAVVTRVQPDRGLVQHVERAHECGAERRRQVDALRFAARQGRRQTVQRQVIQPHVAQKGEPFPDLAQNLVGDRRLLLTQLHIREELLRLANGQRRGGVDRPTADANVARLASEPGAAAVGACQISAIAAQEHADVDFVLLALEPSEEAADTVVSAVAFDDEGPFLVGEIGPRRVETCTGLPRRPLQLRQLRAVMRFAPRLDRTLVDRLRSIGNHQVHVELDDVAEPVARRASAERVVEREEARLRRFVPDAARAAFETL
jgi:hypothetical protein